LQASDDRSSESVSEFVKKGKESVGVARQYCGAMGKVENCQSGVFVGYASEKGYGLLAGRLYMPEIWFSREYEQRRKDNRVPQDLTFQTKFLSYPDYTSLTDCQQSDFATRYS
jgi:SRSO17 transposase